MSKDFVFKNEKEKGKALFLPPKPYCSYYEAYPEPFIDFNKYIRLLPNELVQEGDEYHYNEKWVPVHESRCNSLVGHVFIYRRERAKIPFKNV